MNKKGWWDRFTDGAMTGFFIIAIVMGLMWMSWQWGHQAGWSDGMKEYARQDGGVWMEVHVGEKVLQGYMR